MGPIEIMEALFSADYRWPWSVALALALYFPVRQLIWVMSVRRQERKTGKLPGEEIRHSMKRRAGVTSALLCLVFAAVYGGIIFEGRP